MKIRDLIALLSIIAIVVGPWLFGWYDALTMGIVGFSAVSAGIFTELLMRPRRSITEHAGKHYKIGRTTKGVRIESPDGEVILDRMVVRAGFRNDRGRLVYKRFNLSGFEFNNEALMLTQTFTNPLMEIQLLLQFKKQDPAINMIVSGVINNNIPLDLQHDDGKLHLEFLEVMLLFPFDLSMRELYLKNRTRKILPPMGWMWLGKQGVSLGKGSRCFHMYHVPGISSLRYKRYPQLLSVFIDHVLDHPFVKATASETKPDYLNCSSLNLSAGEKIAGRFAFLAGAAPVVQPVIWMHPKGHDATLIWTTHPDNASLETTRAVVFGDSLWKEPDHPAGGFAAHQIPMTMGVFYQSTHPNHIALHHHQHEAEYRSLIKLLHQQYQFEIALHSASDQCSTRDETDEALQFFSEHFGTVTWIDHSANLQRTALSGEGADKNSRHYIADLLVKHGVRWVWHYGCELKYFKGYDILDDADGINLLQSGKRARRMRHTPLLWQAPQLPEGVRSFKTQAIGRLRHFPMTGLQWFVWGSQQVQKLIKHNGVAIFHDYPFWVYRKGRATGNGIYMKEPIAERWLIDPDFDAWLASLSQLQDQSRLHLSTIAEFSAYQSDMENLTFEYPNPGTIRLRNASAKTINPVLAFPANIHFKCDQSTFIRHTSQTHLYRLTIEPMGSATIVVD